MKHARKKHTKENIAKSARTRGEHSEYTFSYESRLPKKTDADTGSEKKVKKRKKSVIRSKIYTALVICICVGVVVCLGVGAGMYAAISREISETDFDSIAYNFSSIVYADDENGNSKEIEYLHNDGNREWISSDKIPDVAKEAAVAIEDERFYKHNGIDLKRTAGATIGWFASKITGKSPSYGGSTITQQVIKNITQEKDKKVSRKIKEMMRAVALEKHLTKDEILTLYLNIVYFGNQCYGIESASKVYFSKSAADLTLPQAAMIVGTTQAPSRYNPFRNPEDTKTKRNTVLKKMYELGKISEEEYTSASESDLGVNSKYKSLNSTVYSYFVDQVINDVISDLQTKKGYSETFATQQVFSGGLKIYTTMDEKIQNDIESIYTTSSNFPAASKGAQSAMVIIDPYTGQIKGLIGGIGNKTESRGFNRATQAKRQPGSSIKPISVYAPALETGKITAASILTDEQLTIGEWSPKNSYTGFKGDMSVRKAIEISANIPAVKTLQSVGLDTSYNYMKNKMNFSSLTDVDKNLSSLGLGGLTTGVSVKEMAAAYSIFVNGGEYIEPYTYTKVIDSSGKVLLENTAKKTRVISEANAFIMSSFLREVVNGSAGTGRNARLSNMTTYGKTGTTNENCDKWFVGFTPYYVGAVWYGCDTRVPLTQLGVTNNVSTATWKKVMEKVHSGMQSRELSQPDNVTAVSLCQKTGKLSSNGCSYAKTEYFVKGTVPSKYCNNSHGKGTSSVKPTSKPDVDDNTEQDPDISDNSVNNGTISDSEPTSAPSATKVPSAPTQDTPASGNNAKPSDGIITLD